MQPTLNPEDVRAAMRAWTVGVTIVAAAHAGEQHGMTVNSFTTISLEPPLVIISLKDDTRRSSSSAATSRSAEREQLTTPGSSASSMTSLPPVVSPAACRIRRNAWGGWRPRPS